MGVLVIGKTGVRVRGCVGVCGRVCGGVKAPPSKCGRPNHPVLEVCVFRDLH